MIPRRLRMIAAAAALALMLTIVVLSSQSHVDLPDGPWEGRDKLIHASVYGVLGALYALTAVRPSVRGALVAILAAAVFGASDEFHQSFVPGRDASLLDLLADTVGATVGALVAAWYSARRWRPSSPSVATDPASPTTSSSPTSPR